MAVEFHANLGLCPRMHEGHNYNDILRWKGEGEGSVRGRMGSSVWTAQTSSLLRGIR